MATVLKLLYGNKTSPTREVDLSESVSTGRIKLVSGGLGVRHGENNIVYTDPNPRRDGSARSASAFNNARFDLLYMLDGGSRAEVAAMQRKINRFVEDVKQFEEASQGEKTWLRVRWGLQDLPEPVFGQFSHYMHVRAIEFPGWGDLGIIDNNRVIVTATFTCAPYAEGLRQLVGTQLGGPIRYSDDGLLVAGTDFGSILRTNLITNPSFGHSTFDTGWTASGTLEAIKESTPKSATGVGAHLYNPSTSDQTFLQSLTVNNTSSYSVTCLVRRPDGDAPTSSDLQMYGNAALTTTFTDLGDGWYWAYGGFTASGTSYDCGVQVKAGREALIVDVMVVGVIGSLGGPPVPFIAGNLIGCSWSGTAHNSSSDYSNDGGISYSMTGELSGEFTIAGWMKPSFLSGGGSKAIAEYYVDASNFITFSHDSGFNNFTLEKTVGGSSSTDTTGNITYSLLEVVHFTIVQTASTLLLYMNGSLELTINVDSGMPASGTFYVAHSDDLSFDFLGEVDGWRIFSEALTATQISNLYNAESDIKSNGDIIGMPPFFWTKDGDDVLDAVDGVISSAEKDNWGILGGVAGDVPAYTEWQLDPVNSPSEVFWLGVKAVDSAFTPYDALWHDFDTVADAGNSSGDGYDTDTTSASASDQSRFENSIADFPLSLKGTYQVLARFKVTGNAADVLPFLRLGSSNRIYFDTLNVATDASFLFRDFGQMIIGWPQDDPYRIRVGIEAQNTVASANTHQLDFFQLLPIPWCRVEAEDATVTTASGDKLVIRDDRAWITDSSDSDSQLYLFHWRGTPVHARPNKYNYVFVLQGEEGVAYPVSDTVTMSIYVTPRWILPGGPVA